MPLVEENWQTKRSTVRARTKFVFNNDLFSDVKFVVLKSDGESESRQVIPAHKIVLSIAEFRQRRILQQRHSTYIKKN